MCLTRSDTAHQEHLLLCRGEEREVVGRLVEALEQTEVQHMPVLNWYVALGELRVVEVLIQDVNHGAHGVEEAVNELVEGPALEVAVRVRVLRKLAKGRDHELEHALGASVGMLSLRLKSIPSKTDLRVKMRRFFLPSSDAQPNRERCGGPR